jgi:4-amino-4-deoxy-L-arabinose transferase-like glycosyltransferase
MPARDSYGMDVPTAFSATTDAVAPPRGGSWAATRTRVAGRLEALALPGVTVLAAVLYVFNLTVSGYANAYYSMAAQAASLNWTAWFFGSLDPANFITVDKPPLSTMLMGLSVRLFGLSSWSILLPEALAGIATVALLFVAVRRYFGTLAATIAAIVAALTPAAVLIFRYNNPDALLTLLLVASAYCFMRALEAGRLRWVIAAALLVGLAFNTKFLQAYLVLPAFALTYFIAAPGSILRRFGHLLAALVTVLVSSFWWIAVVELTPAVARPFIGGSASNSALELVFGYDGLQRIFGFLGLDGRFGAPGGGAGPGAGFSGEPGLLRLFNSEFGGQVAWLLPAALVALAVGLLVRRHAPRTDLRRAAFLMWGGWLLVTGLVFSLMGGIVHSYYAVALVPAIGALVGAGAVELWALRRAGGTAGLVATLALAGALTATALLGAFLLARTPDFAPWLIPLVLLAAAIADVGLLLPAVSPRLAAAAAVLGIAAMLAGPAAYAAVTINTAYSGGDPQPGPAADTGFGAGPGGRAGLLGGLGQGLQAGAAGDANDQLISYLEANKGDATWLVAVASSNEAAPIQLATGDAVMAVGGFNGSDNALSVEELQAYVASGQLRYFLVSGGGFGSPGIARGATGSSDATVLTWVVGHGTLVDQVGGGQLYDLSGAG